MVRYVPFADVRVSRRWRVVLLAARKAGVEFRVSSGHRTIREQTKLFRQNMRLVGGRWVPRPGHPLTAFPSPNAPHIFTGRAAHALDVDLHHGTGPQGLAKWLRQHGVHVTFPVPGEAWHLVANGADLKRLSDRLHPKPKPRSLFPQTTSSKGRDFLAREEGLVPYAYNDPAGHATFGVGHLIHLGNVTAEDARKWGTKARPHSRRYVMRVFKRDLRKYEKAVRESTGHRLRPEQFDACTSLCFNIGEAGFRSSSVAQHLRNGPVTTRAQDAADAFLLWDQPSMLRPRRQRERALFLTGKYR